MIVFKQKVFSEFDAMRSLYVRLNKLSPGRFQMIKLNSLLPILKGNNVVIERFVISTGFFKRDTYRMYLKIGARAKMPDEVRLPQNVYDKRLLDTRINFGFNGGDQNNNNNQQQKPFSDTTENASFKMKIFNDKKKKKGGGDNGGGGDIRGVKTSMSLPVDISYEVKELLGEAINYDKKSRSLVLEFRSIDDAIDALNILPFGVNYKIYLLDIDS